MERHEHHVPPADVVERLTLAGGTNPFGEPNFRVVWGYDRVIPIHGEWQDFETIDVKMPDGKRKLVRLKTSKIETRMVPKYLPGNRWHLEKWCPPEMYGTPETWSKAGEEIIGQQTIDTSGPFPHRGEYELVLTLSTDGGPNGEFIPLIPAVVEEIVKMVQASKDFTLGQRRAAIIQREERKEKLMVNRYQDILRDSLRPFAGESFIVRP